MAVLEEQQGTLTFRQYVRAQLQHLLETKPDGRIVASWQSLHMWLNVTGLRYAVDRFGNGIITSADGRWAVAASKIDSRLKLKTLEASLHEAFTPSKERPTTCGYKGGLRNDRFSAQQWAAYEEARRHYREHVQPKVLAELSDADQRYRQRLKIADDVKTLLQQRARTLSDPVQRAEHELATLQIIRRAKARIKERWFTERGAVYAAHERAPARTIGRWLTHRPPVLPPMTSEATLRLAKARAVQTDDGTDYYQEDVRIATQIQGILRTTIPSLTRSLERAAAPKTPLPPYKELLWVSGPADVVAEFSQRFGARVVRQLDDALLLRPWTPAERDSLERAARDLKLKVGDPYALARLERDGKSPSRAKSTPRTEAESRVQARPLRPRKRRGRY